MRITARRRNDGQALRDAMKAEGMGLEALSARTKLASTDGKGVSVALLGFLTQPAGKSRHARETTSPETADLIETALGRPAGSLFDRVEAPGRGDPQPGWDELNVSAR